VSPDIRRVAAPIGDDGSGDLGILSSLHAACFAQAWSPEAFRVLLAMPGSLGLLGFVGDTPQGLLIARRVAEEAEILSLCVVPPMRRHGLASALLAVGIECLERAGAAKVFLEVAETNMAAQEVYRVSGFSLVGRRPDYYLLPGGCGVAALVLVRSLAGVVAARSDT